MQYADDVVVQMLGALARRKKSAEPVGLPTGLEQLDVLIGGGFQRQTLTYLVGDSGVGKSLLASQILLNSAEWLHARGAGPASAYAVEENDQAFRRHVQDKTGKLPVGVFWSLEMSEGVVAARLLTQATKAATGKSLDSGLLQRGDIPDVDALQEGYNHIHSVGHNIVLAFREQTIADLRMMLIELTSTHDVCLVVVDYFRLIQDIILDATGAGRQEAVSRDLMRLAREFDCAVVCIFDLNREGQKRRRPTVTDMKWGSGPQYDADQVILMWKDKEMEELQVQHIYVELAKSRNGPKGKTELALEVQCGTFSAWRQHR